jgi:small redox-active disulfide protein 2
VDEEVMVKIQVLGAGCAKCRLLEENLEQALKASGIKAEIEKVTNLDEIMNFGVMMTPALVVDGEVKSVGKVLSKEQLRDIIKKED